MVLESRHGGILVRQVAGFIARRTVCRVGVGAQLQQGQRFGMIKFGSRVDVYLPAASRAMVQVDQRVTAGETILAAMPMQD
jgi:phosphatidylserine decarboxylase